MAYVNIPNDLSKIKSKIAFGLTKRQLVCFGLAAAVGVPAYLLTRTVIGNTGAMILMIVLMLPFFLLALYERDGLPFEKVLRNIIRATYLWPRTRPYTDTPALTILRVISWQNLWVCILRHMPEKMRERQTEQ